jgi:RNA polymerase sigma-70 factor (ECF subfamily)
MVQPPGQIADASAALLFHSPAACGIVLLMSTAQPRHAHELAPLMRAVAAGDRTALADLYGRTSGKLYGICVRLLGSEPEAEEVLQDVYLTVWNKADRFDGDKASPITWLAVLARNKSIDRLRRQRAPTTTLDDAPDLADEGPSALEVLEQDEDSKRLDRCLEELEQQQQTAIRAAFLDGATYPQLAEREQVPLGTMKSWIRRGLIRLRGCLER